ncbi:3'-5' exonuclease [Myceligenerans halotolerans]
MAQVIMVKDAHLPDNNVAGQVMAFLNKLMTDDTSSSLHIERINGAVDRRIRTGRVNVQWRALLVKVQGQGETAHYVYLGTFKHDQAISMAKTYRVDVDDGGIASFIRAERETRPTDGALAWRPSKVKPEDIDGTPWSRLQVQGVTVEAMVGLGMDEAFAQAALEITDDDELQEHAASASSTWQGSAMLDLAFGSTSEEVRAAYGLGKRSAALAGSDEELLAALRHPAASMQFSFLESDDDLRAAVENPDFGAWRTFLHPEQRRYATARQSGSFRVTGGAGTGKTVILLHRARHLARQNPSARVVLTTFNTTLADSLRDNLLLLDPKAPLAAELGSPGIYIAGVDAIARRVLVNADRLRLPFQEAVSTVLSTRPADIMGNTSADVWQQAAEGSTLPAYLLSSTFLMAEYATCVLPGNITSLEQYIRVRRHGRGVALTRAQRAELWQVFDRYRALSATAGTTSFEEKTALATSALALGAKKGVGPLADHVLVDEAQDLTPSRLLLLRALVAAGPDDLFLAEDSQQRIYGQKVTLSHHGIRVQGRSRRLKLNYRTTAQNLEFALRVLDGVGPEDLDGDATEVAGYRSARSGPKPRVLEFPTRKAEVNGAAETVAGWIAAGDAPETIGVLVRSAWAVNDLADALRAVDISARPVANRERPATGQVPIMTMHRAKGMEFLRVIIVGMSEKAVLRSLTDLPEEERDAALQQERSLVYVAATRPRDELVVTWSGHRSPLVPERG